MTQQTPLVSIIMPAYNCEAYIAKAIQSVLQQTYLNWELLIADDASTDRTPEIINSITDLRIRKFSNPTNIGNVATRNNLFSQAKGELITVLDADDLMEDNRLKEQIAAFSNDKELRACFTNYYEIDIRGHQKKRHDLQHDYYLNKENFSDMFCSMPATIMIRKEVYDEIGGLHEYFDRLFAEDRYWIYLIIERYTALLLKTPLYGYRANPISLTNEIDNARKLTIVELVNELIRQRKVRGSDWLSEGAFDKAMDFEQSLMKNKRWLSEQYRIFAATQIDLLKLHQAKKLLLTAYRLNPFNFSILRTLFYLLRRPCHSVRLNF